MFDISKPLVRGCLQAASWSPQTEPRKFSARDMANLSPLVQRVKPKFPPVDFFGGITADGKLPRRPAIVAIASTGIVVGSRAKCDVS